LLGSRDIIVNRGRATTSYFEKRRDATRADIASSYVPGITLRSPVFSRISRSFLFTNEARTAVTSEAIDRLILMRARIQYTGVKLSEAE